MTELGKGNRMGITGVEKGREEYKCIAKEEVNKRIKKVSITGGKKILKFG